MKSQLLFAALFPLYRVLAFFACNSPYCQEQIAKKPIFKTPEDKIRVAKEIVKGKLPLLR
jgi:hypothetical protein